MSCNLANVFLRREEGGGNPLYIQHLVTRSRSSWDRLGLDRILRGHQGCVNHVQFNESGLRYASNAPEQSVPLGTHPLILGYCSPMVAVPSAPSHRSCKSRSLLRALSCFRCRHVGSLLGTGSDDLHLNLYSIPSGELLKRYDTHHTANIFCVKFLPYTGKAMVINAVTSTGVHAV